MLVLLHNNYYERGPGKVLNNFKSGLLAMGIEYRENPETVEKDDYVIILQWSNLAGRIARLSNKERLVIGPNICTYPNENEFVMSGEYKSLVVPSEWVKILYSKWINTDKIDVWGSGIETEKFIDTSNNTKSIDFLIYFKNRGNQELDRIENILSLKRYSHTTLIYGSYTEDQLLMETSRCKFCIVIVNTESQGIAIQEIMSTNTPMIVIDKTHWDEMPGVKATSVPYWSEECGIKISDIDDLDSAIEKISTGFFPRNFIVENLNLLKSARDLLKIVGYI
jgi:hypothetical protein